ncbi:MAG: 50S ribosomal protein L24 [Desulfobacterales bacterium]|nr:50S ribosomal protein L24 [Desulfobacterales bacterium]MBF0396455.1 50S ribosomal protein L24 [Desulfobacterales bacterium]
MLTNKLNMKKDDKVKVISGKDKGKIGKIIKVLPAKNKVVIESINKIKRHVKPGRYGKESGIVEREAPIHVSNVMLMCSKCVTPARIGKKYLEDGKKVRVCKKCNEIIDA